MTEAPPPDEAGPASESEAALPSWLVPKLVVLVSAFAVSFGIDMATKAWVAAQLPIDGPPRTVIDGLFLLSHSRNAGTAFGFFEDWPVELRRVGFSVLAAVAGWVVVLFYRGLAPRDRVHGLALGLIVGGGLGNLVDRLGRGEVIDFLRFELWGPWSFPDFNFADVFIMMGIGILMTELLVSEGAARAEVIEERSASLPPHPDRGEDVVRPTPPRSRDVDDPD
jgi:signal peptidase II